MEGLLRRGYQVHGFDREPTMVDYARDRLAEFRTYDDVQFLALLRKVPELSLVATHNFSYRADEEVELGEDDLDAVVILQRN